MTTYLAGAVARSTATFVPASGTVDIGDVTCRSISAEGTVTTHTAEDSGTANVFYTDINIPDAAISGPWDVLWTSGDPDIVFEDSFQVTARRVPTA